MLYEVGTCRSGVKVVDDLNFVYRPAREYDEKKTCWKCENRKCKARGHSVLENDVLFIYKIFGEHCDSSHPSKPKVYLAKTKLKSLTPNSQILHGR